MIEIHRYSPEQCARWDDFVAASRNGTFLHKRGYMDYHADRFSDFSLVATDAHGRWRAILPACRIGNELHSHAGLTFAGWIMDRKTDALVMCNVVEAMIPYLRAQGIDTIIYKAIPYIYTDYPAEEDVYALLRHGAILKRTMIASAVDLANPIPFDMSYRQDVRRARNLGVEVREAVADGDWIEFWQLLTAHLKSRFNTSPVHTLAEISLLKGRFPENIRLYIAHQEGTLLGGVVVYHSKTAAHSQYTAISDQGRAMRILPSIHAFAMDAAGKMGERYFDFGTSADSASPTGVNEGLISQKIASGGRGVLYNTYTLSF